MSDLNFWTVRCHPSLCPRLRDLPAGLGYRNYSEFTGVATYGLGHGPAGSQLEVKVMIMIASVEMPKPIQL